MGITVNAKNMPIFQRLRTGGLKSAEQKAERQQKRDNQLAVLEKQKADLKNRECGSVDEIESKLDLLHSYDDQISAVKHAFNMEQISHILDEAKEKGEKIAEEIKKLLPETEEERIDTLLEEALDGEEGEGMLSELLDELPDSVEEMEITEEAARESAERMEEELARQAEESYPPA